MLNVVLSNLIILLGLLKDDFNILLMNIIIRVSNDQLILILLY